MNAFELSRKWFDFCIDNPEKVNTNQTALYFYCIDLCNRLAWSKSFGLPTLITMQYTSIKSYKTYAKALQDLIDFGFLKLIEKSKNQYSANVVALVNFTEAVSKQRLKQVQSNDQSRLSINKPLKTYKTIKHIEEFNLDSFDFQFQNKKIATEYKKAINYSENPFEYCVAALIENRLFVNPKDKVSKTAFTGLVNRLKKMSGNKTEVAYKLTNNAISSNWKTFYPINEKENNDKPKLNL